MAFSFCIIPTPFPSTRNVLNIFIPTSPTSVQLRNTKLSYSSPPKSAAAKRHEGAGPIEEVLRPCN